MSEVRIERGLSVTFERPSSCSSVSGSLRLCCLPIWQPGW